jgi:selenocysteine-specific elongation factor
MTSTPSDETAGRHGAREGEQALHVVATAGHVDHGKSSLILRLTGMDPDRWAEEKRRGLTIDLGFAWGELPSGREIAFVDVPGHERFIRNMLAGVGPVRRVLFVVAADEGWKPQSEEHLSIVDLLGATGVVALTKSDLVDEETLAEAARRVRDRLGGTSLEDAPIVPCSSHTGAGLEELRAALERLTAGGAPADGGDRPRLFVDRVFSIKGAGTVVTGTLIDGCLSSGDEVAVLPAGARARIRGLQTHKRFTDRACPVSRVAMNVVGVERGEVARGDVIARYDDWRPTRTLEARIRPVRALGHSLTARGAYKVYVGSAEADATLRPIGATEIHPGGHAFVRIRTTRPLVLDVFDPIVLREVGRRETVAGGRVIDIEPPRRQGHDAGRLEARWAAGRHELPRLLAEERGAVRLRDARVLTGVEDVGGSANVRDWIVDPAMLAGVEKGIRDFLAASHAAHPLLEGETLAMTRARVGELLSEAGAPKSPELVDAMLETMVASGTLARSASAIRLATHDPSLAGDSQDLRRVVAALEAGEPAPPSVDELLATGVSRDVIEAAVRSGALIRVSAELVVRPTFVDAALAALRDLQAAGRPSTVSAFRERLGTTRKYAVPLLEYFDQQGVTRRQGDVRVLRGPTSDT